MTKNILALQVCFFLFPSSAFSQTISYTLSMPEPWTHYYHVTQTIKGERKKSIDFVMPVWIPGSYKVREFSKNVEEFKAHSEKSDNLKWEKIDKNSWRVYTNKANEVTISYKVYAFVKSVRNSFLDDSHGFVSPPDVFMYVEKLKNRPATLVIDPYDEFLIISTGLEKSPGSKNSYIVPDYDVLVDSPIEIGNQTIFEFEVEGVPHEIAFYGKGNYDSSAVDEVKRIVEATAKLFGEIPYKRYLFIVHLTKSASGGLEHLNSQVLRMGRWNFQPASRRGRWRSLVAHEVYHLYNVKRIRARELGPFDYTRENYTSLLWVMEGFTSYYSGRILLNAGFISPKKYQSNMASNMSKISNTIGNRYQSAAEASFDAWIRYYRRNENSPNRDMSYYDKGKLLGMLLDLEIRNSSGNKKTLDDVMRRLYSEYYKKKQRGFSEAEFKKELERAAGINFSDFFVRYVHGTEEVDYGKYLSYAGLEIETLEAPSLSEKGAFLGTRVSESSGKLKITQVLRDSPAWNYGLNVNDEIIAVDGLRVGLADYTKAISAMKPGDKVVITISRDDWLREIDVVISESSDKSYYIFQTEEPTELQKAVYESYFSTAWEKEPEE